MCHYLAICKTRTNPYRPQSDGQVERFNRTLIQCLKPLVNSDMDDWDEQCDFVCHAYNSTVHASTNCSPNLLVFGEDLIMPADLVFGMVGINPLKVLERLMHDTLFTHLDVHGILSEKQGGYQKGKSTTDSISVFIDDILLNCNIGKFSLASFIDIKKAFDSVNYTILLKKLKLYGVRNRSLTLIENYLSMHQQCTVANNVRSRTVSLTCGVPQGSILGPLFFLIYINDCISTLDEHKTMLYAND